VKALSLKQPWAYLVVHGHKPIENRTWSTSMRGRVLIHASMKTDLRGLDEAIALGIYVPPLEALPHGGIVGEVEVVGCVTDSDSPWFEGPYGFVLKRGKPLPFRKMRGHLRFFEVSETECSEEGR
jgi:hypothetical protein